MCDDRIVHAGVRESHAVILVHDDDGWRRLPGGPRYVYDLAEIDRRVIAIASSSAATSMVWELDIDLGAWRVLVGTNEPERDIEVRRSPGGVPFVWRPAIDGATAPGLVVMIHGGPTAYASLEFDWLSELIRLSGFAVASVDYRGSTSYGRDYRRALLGQWGRADVADVISVIEYLSGSGEVDPGAIFVRGSSAGAMTALLVSTHPLVAGVVTTSGVTELRTLLESTIELERQYTLDLVGGPSMLEERSPFAHVAQMARSMLVMHGVDDEVVPIAQARTFADAARAAGVEVELVEFAGEGHGIRGANNQRAAYRHELDFYARTRQPPERVG